MIKGIKIMLLPNNKQKTKLIECAGAARFVYNWVIAKQKENYKNGGKFLHNYDLKKELTKLKQTEKYDWLDNYSRQIINQSIKDACGAYENFFNGRGYPKFKSRKKSTPSFYARESRIQFTETHVKLEKLTNSKKRNKQKLNWIKLAEKNRVPINGKYYNPRVTFDGLNWWLSVGIEYPDKEKIPSNEGMGIDLGIKDLAVTSNGDFYKNVNKTNKVKKLEKKKKRLQRKVSKKYEKNKKGASYCKTNNIKKLEEKLLKLNKRLTNIRQNYIHQTTSEIIKRKPSFIVMENLNVAGMMKNKHLSKAIQEQKFYEFKRQIQYKSTWNNIEFIQADRFYPSSKLCSVCGNIKKDLKLSDRVYKCECGNVIDRDLNAAINLKNYGCEVMKSAI
jgi:putative transposase